MNAGIRTLRVVLAAVLALAALAGCTSDSTGDYGDYQFRGATKIGVLIPEDQRKPAEKITGEMLDGKSTFSLADHKGSVVVLNFWATWCPPCVVETPQLEQVYQQYKTDHVLVVGVNSKNFPRSQPQAFVADNDITYPMVYDEKGEIALKLGNIPAKGLPFSVLIDKKGRVAAVYLSVLTGGDLDPPLKTLRAET